MQVMREETGQPLNREKMEGLHLKYKNLAKGAREKEDWVLAESYYQRAEHYLHAMNYTDDSIPLRPCVGTSQPSAQVKALQEGKVLPFRGSFLRRNRRNTKDKGISG